MEYVLLHCRADQTDVLMNNVYEIFKQTRESKKTDDSYSIDAIYPMSSGSGFVYVLIGCRFEELTEYDLIEQLRQME